MDDRAVGAEPSEFENSLARWAARVAAVLLVVSMAAMPSMVAWLDEDEIAAASAARGPAAVNAQAGTGGAEDREQAPSAVTARVRAPDTRPAAISPAGIGQSGIAQSGAGLSAGRAGAPVSGDEGPAAHPPVNRPTVGDSAAAAQAGLWSAPADRVSIPLQPFDGAAGPESPAELSDEEWLAQVMLRVGERANRTAAAAFRALDGFLFENRPSKKGIALLPPPGEQAPLPVPGIPVLALPQPAGPDADLLAPPAATPGRAAAPVVTERNRSAARMAQADRLPAAADPRPSRSGAPPSLKSPDGPTSLRAGAVPRGNDDRRTSQGPVSLRR